MSRRHTPAASRSVVPNSDHIASLQSKVRDIEQRLAAALSSGSKSDNSSSKQVNRYRMLLCEWYSDWILSDPASAAVHAVGPLWRSCFYGRIGPARTRLQKDQRALEKQQKSGGDTEALPASIRQQTESLQVFLREGITLYEYLCDKLQYELLQQQPEQESSSNTNSGRVPCLYRLYISLGDLYRYSGGGSSANATKSYHIAAVLGPGHGHAYNQLAVMDQLTQQAEQAQTAVTVYWYARSLAATVEPFATATANLIRLFEQNRASLRSSPPILSAASSTNSGKSSSQAARSRHCLAQLVDVQYRFFLLSQQSQLVNVDDDDDVWSHVTECVDAFAALLLHHSAWGDHLLAKLVTVLAFSERHCASNMELYGAARGMTLRLGEALGARVAKILAAKQQPPSSLRVLWPLLLLTEYLLHSPEPLEATNAATVERYRAARGAFWHRIVLLYNSVVATGWEMVESESAPVAEILEEYQEWRGFAPFAPFVASSSDDTLVDGFLSDRATAQLLQLSSGSDTAESSLRSSGSQSWSLRSTNTSSSTVSMKLRRFLSLRPLLLSSPAVDGHIRASSASEQLLEWIDVPLGNGDDMVPMEDDDDDGGGDVILPSSPSMDLVYQPNPAGGPALLVPTWSAAAALPPPSTPWGDVPPPVAPPPGFVATGWPASTAFPSIPNAPTEDHLFGESMLWLGGPVALQTTNPFVRDAGGEMDDHHGLSAGLLRSLLLGETATGTKNPFA